ncbi:MAG: ABC transporter substrate-binding protein [Kineosporiaceae bacterium]
MSLPRPTWPAPVLGAAAVAVLLAACSGGAPGADSADPASPADDGTGEVELADSLTLWGAQETPDVVTELVDRYGQERGVDVEFVTVPGPFDQNVLTRWTTGDRPDVMFFQPASWRLRQLQVDNLQPLDDLGLEERQRFDLTGESGSVDGVQYAATFGFPAVFGVFYNRAVFEEQDLQPPTTYEEFLDVARTLDEAGVDPVHLAGGEPWTLQLGPFEWLTDAAADGLVEDINANEAEWTDERVVESFERLRTLVGEGLVNDDHTTATYVDQQQALVSGEAGMVIQASWIVPALTGSQGEEAVDSVGYFPMPNESGAVMWQASNLGSAVLPRTGDPAAEATARDFLTWLTTDAYPDYLEGTGEPSVFSDVEDPPLDDLTSEVVEAFEAESIPSLTLQAAADYGPLAPNLGELVAGVRDPQGVAEAMQTEFARNAEASGLDGW